MSFYSIRQLVSIIDLIAVDANIICKQASSLLGSFDREGLFDRAPRIEKLIIWLKVLLYDFLR